MDEHDKVTVTGNQRQKIQNQARLTEVQKNFSYTFSNNSAFGSHDAIKMRSGVIKNAQNVTVTFDMAPLSSGGDGFLLCFQCKYVKKGK